MAGRTEKIRTMTPEEARAELVAEERAEWAKKFENHENEFTTEEVIAKCNDPKMQSREIEAFRQRMAFEHMKLETDPSECPGFFITRNGNLRRDY